MGFFSSLAWIIITFLFFTVMVAVVSSLKTKEDNLDTAEGYFLASRSLPGVVIAGSLLLTNLSAEQLVGLNGQSWATNMSPIGWEVGSIFTLLILAYYFLPRYLKMGTTTIPALMEERFGKSTKLVFSTIIVIMYSILNLPVILYSGAVVFERIFDISGMIGCSKFAAVAGLCVLHYMFPIIQVCETSMFPTYDDGEIIFGSRLFNKSNLKVGDVIVYKHDGKNVIKRIADIMLDTRTGNLKFFCVGDNARVSCDSRKYGYVPSKDLVCKIINQRRFVQNNDVESEAEFE